MYDYDRRRTASDEEPEEAIYKSDLRAMSPERRAAWKGYRWHLVTEVFTPEEQAEDQDEARNTTSTNGHAISLEEVAEHLAPLDKWESWTDEWIHGKGKKDRKGNLTRHSVSIERADGQRFTHDEKSFLQRQLKIR